MSKMEKLISIVLKTIVIVSALVGTFLSASAGRDSFMGGLSVCMFFTIQSNIAIAIICMIIVGLIYLLILDLINKVRRSGN